MLRLKILGGLSVESGAAPLTGAATQRRRLALLALLAGAGERGMSRDKLLGYLWPDSDAEKGRNVLAQALYALRRDLGAEQLFLGTSDLRLNPDVITSDVAEFRAALSAGRLEDAVASYAGPFLDGIYIGEAPEFERWVENERTGLAHDYRAALERLATAAEGQGDHRAATGWWRRLAVADPLSSRVALRLMQALADSGDRAGAIQHARVYETMLRQELDAAPDAEVVRLAERLRREAAAPAAAPAAAGSPAAGASPAPPDIAEPPSPAAAPSPAAMTGQEPARPASRRAGRRRVVLLGAAALGVVLVALAFAAPRFFAGRTAPDAARKMIVVLPFRNLGKPEDEYFADGLTEEVTARLAGIAGLGVISRTSSMQYKQTAKPLRQVGRELGAAYVLEGSVRWERLRDGTSRVRVTPQLIEVSGDSYLWADRYDADLADVFQVQGRIAEEVASALDIRLGGKEREDLAARPTRNVDAYDAYLRAGLLMDRAWADPTAIKAMIAAYERAVKLDPAFADAWARLSVGHTLAYRRNVDVTPHRLDQAKAAADSAFRLEPDLPAGHLAMGYYHYWGRREYAAARREFHAALARRPSDPDALYGLGAVERREGRWPDAVLHLCQSADQDPRSSSKAWDCALAQFFTRDYPAAERYVDRSIALDSGAAFSYTTKARIYLAWRGDTAAARRVVEGARGHADLATLAAGLQGTLFLLTGPAWDSAAASLTVKKFEDSPVDYFFWKGWWNRIRGERPAERAAWDSLLAASSAEVKEHPGSDESWTGLAMAFAGLGRGPEALRAIARAEESLPLSRDAAWGADRAVLFAQMYVLMGDADRAIVQLDQLLSIPSPVSRAGLRVDPAYEPIRSDPRFQRLLDQR